MFVFRWIVAIMAVGLIVMFALRRAKRRPRPRATSSPSTSCAVWFGPWRRTSAPPSVLKIREVTGFCCQLKLALKAGGKLDWSLPPSF